MLKKIPKKICLSNLWLWGYLMKVVTIFDFEGTWWRLLQSLTLRVPDEGCYNLWLWGYLMKVVTIFDFEVTWWRLFQSLTLRVPDEGYSNLWPWGYLMKVIPIFDLEGTWWRLLQKHVANTTIDILVYDFINTFFYISNNFNS